MFPFATVVECPQERMIESIGPTLVCSAITEQPDFKRRLIDATHIDRLNIGPIPTIKLDWLQPHEGNIVEFLFRARAFQIPKDKMSAAPADGTAAPARPVTTRCSPRRRCRIDPDLAAGGRHERLRFSAAHANRLRTRQDRIAGRTGRRTGSPAGAGRHRSGHRGGRTRRARRGGPASGPASRRVVFDDVARESDDRARRRRPGRRPPPFAGVLIGLGGGSSMDCAKGINFLYTNGGRMQDYWGIGKATQADAAHDRRADHGRAPAARRNRSP